jgi:hypothetical protein
VVLPDERECRVKRLGIVNAWADPKFKAAVVATGRTPRDRRSNAPHSVSQHIHQPGTHALYLFSCRAGEILHGGWSAGRHAHDALPNLNEQEQAAFIEKVKALAPQYRTELLREA